jgi:hypothetical protein
MLEVLEVPEVIWKHLHFGAPGQVNMLEVLEVPEVIWKHLQIRPP